MTAAEAARIFEEARRLAPHNRRAAVELFKRVVELPPGPEWGDAQLEVAGWAFEWDHREEARERFQSIVEADPSVRSELAWRTAAVTLSLVLEDLDLPVDTDLLRRALAACEVGGHEHDEYSAGIAAGHLARIELASGRRDAAREYLMRAERHYNAARSMYAEPGAAYQLAKLAAEDGDLAAATEWLRRGLAHLANFPHAGRSVREMRQKLKAFLAQLGGRG